MEYVSLRSQLSLCAYIMALELHVEIATKKVEKFSKEKKTTTPGFELAKLGTTNRGVGY